MLKISFFLFFILVLDMAQSDMNIVQFIWNFRRYIRFFVVLYFGDYFCRLTFDFGLWNDGFWFRQFNHVIFSSILKKILISYDSSTLFFNRFRRSVLNFTVVFDSTSKWRVTSSTTTSFNIAVIRCDFLFFGVSINLFVKSKIVVDWIPHMLYFVILVLKNSLVNIVIDLSSNNKKSIANVNTNFSNRPLLTFQVFKYNLTDLVFLRKQRLQFENESQHCLNILLFDGSSEIVTESLSYHLHYLCLDLAYYLRIETFTDLLQNFP